MERPTADELRVAGSALRRWYARHRRDLPWRRCDDAYSILVSEVMLQQTQTSRAAPYFERFVERYPDAESLAAAGVDEVLALWSGLGYYRRARRLHAAAKEVVRRGGVPRTLDELRELPGVGPYTAAAVGSLAHGIPAPALDGNGRRVLSRLVGLEQDPRRAVGARRLEVVATAMLDPERPGESNEALMELGATVCTPRSPRCSECPLRPWCAAAASGDPERYPVRTRRTSGSGRSPVTLRHLAAVVREGERVLLAERGEDEELLAGTWEVPWAERVDDADEDESEELARALACRYAGRWELGARVGTVRHSITYRRYEVDVWEGRWRPPAPPSDAAKLAWFDAAARAELPTSSLVDKIVDLGSSSAGLNTR